MSAATRFREAKASPLCAPKSASRRNFSASRKSSRSRAHRFASHRKISHRYDRARQDRQSLQTDPVGYRTGLNLYWYVGNDPLNLSDPTGLYTCQVRAAPSIGNLFGLLSSGSTASECAAIDSYIAGIGTAASKLPENSPERARLENIAGTYGERGVDNGVHVSAAQLSRGTLGDATYDGTEARVRFDVGQINAASQRTGHMATGSATGVGVAAHEGDHVVRLLTGQTPSASYVERYRFEVPAYQAQASVFRAEGVWGSDVTARAEGIWVAQGARNSAQSECAVGPLCD